jgi:hypothetical protein
LVVQRPVEGSSSLAEKWTSPVSASSRPPAAHPAPEGFAAAYISPAGALDAELGPYVLDWDDARRAPDPHAAALEFAASAVRHGCAVCGWDPDLADSALGSPPPVH